MDAVKTAIPATSLDNLSRPTVKLIGHDGNSFAILGTVMKALRKVGWKGEQIEAFLREATSGDYDQLLQTCMKYADVD